MEADTLRVIKTLRAQAWERAKGELQAVLSSYWERDQGNFDYMQRLTEAFISEVEDNELQG